MATQPRTAGPDVEPLFLERWSTRAYDGSALTDAELDTLLDAARWAPSAYNLQPWRFLYARRDDANWARFLDLLVPFNRDWAQHGGVLLFALSDTLKDGAPGEAPVPSTSNSFDAGAAWMLLALQAARLGLSAHGMAGFDRERASVELGVPDRFRIEAAIVVGRPGDKAQLPEPLQAREVQSGRNPIEAFAAPGPFAF